MLYLLDTIEGNLEAAAGTASLKDMLYMFSFRTCCFTRALLTEVIAAAALFEDAHEILSRAEGAASAAAQKTKKLAAAMRRKVIQIRAATAAAGTDSPVSLANSSCDSNAASVVVAAAAAAAAASGAAQADKHTAAATAALAAATSAAKQRAPHTPTPTLPTRTLASEVQALPDDPEALMATSHALRRHCPFKSMSLHVLVCRYIGTHTPLIKRR
jgi:hypothetical protein